MARSNNFQVRVSSDTSQFDAGMRRAQQELRAFADVARSAFSIVGVTSFAAAIGSAVDNISRFEQANSELAAVLGKDLKGVTNLANAAKELGVQSKYTASEVTALQVSLARLGFSEAQITAMEAPILKFATAMNTDLASAADFAGAALRAFGLRASDTGMLLDVMSASTTNSALDFEKLQTSISTVAPIAKSFGLDAKETAALLGVLSNTGFDASTAATSLRNILLEAAKDGGKVQKAVGGEIKTFDDLTKALRTLKEAGMDLTQASDLVSKKAASAFLVLAEGVDDVVDLKGKLDEANGSLDQMADTMADNLIGSINNLKSAWEGFTLKLSESKGILRGTVDLLTEFLRMFTGNDSRALVNKDLQALRDSIEANNLMAQLSNGGTLNRRQQKRYDKLLANGYITPQGAYQVVTEEAPATAMADVAGSGEVAAAKTKKAADAMEELTKQARAAAREAAEIAAADAEMAEAGNAIYEQWRALNGLSTQPFSNEELAMYNDQLRLTEAYWKDIADAEAEAAEKASAAVSRQADALERMNEALTAMIPTLTVEMSAAIGGLIGDLATGGDAWGNFGNAALSAFGDMAMNIGKIAIETGIAAAGIQLALKRLQPGVAIAAGVALVALGAAVKAGLSNVASGNYSAGTSVASSAYGYGGQDYETRELTVNVTGTLQADGDQLTAVLNNTNNKKGYTT